ncbi:hypothetical protein D3C81_1774510 [compost metagenome]
MIRIEHRSPRFQLHPQVFTTAASLVPIETRVDCEAQRHEIFHALYAQQIRPCQQPERHQRRGRVARQTYYRHRAEMPDRQRFARLDRQFPQQRFAVVA